MPKTRASNTELTKKHRTFRRQLFTDKEIREFSEHLRKAMGPEIVELSRTYGISIEDNLRFQSVAIRLEEARTAKGMTLKETAATLKIPRYRLNDVERGSTSRLRPEIVLRYIEFLGLARWFGKWKKANAEFAERMGFTNISQLKN